MAEVHTMFIASKYSKILHYEPCRYVSKIKKENRMYFYTLEQAIKHNVSFCLHCYPLIKMVKREKNALDKFCNKFNIEYYLSGGRIIANTCTDEWQILYLSKKMPIAVFHKNHITNGKLDESLVSGYHKQKMNCSSILSVMEAIYDHLQKYLNESKFKDGLEHKVIKANNRQLRPAKKGIKYRRIARKKRKLKNRKETYNLLCVLDKMK